MKKNQYYSELINNIEILISANKFKEAHILISEEMSMPYIPRNVEEQLYSFIEKLKKEGIDNPPVYKPDFDKIIEMLKDESTNHQIKHGLIEMLANFNLRNKMDVISEVLQFEIIELFIKKDLLKILKDQNIDYKLIVKYKNDKIQIDLENFEIENTKKIKNIQENLLKLLKDHPLALEVANEMTKWLVFNSEITKTNIEGYELALSIMIAKNLQSKDLIDKLMKQVLNIDKLEQDINDIQTLLKL